MITTRIILMLAALFGLIQWFRIKDIWIKIILGGLIISIVCAFIPIPMVKMIAYILYTLSILIAIIHGLVRKNIDTKKRIVMFFICAPVFIGNLFGIMHWPYANEISLLMLIPLILFLSRMLPNAKKYKNELGILTIITTHATIRLVKLVYFIWILT